MFVLGRLFLAALAATIAAAQVSPPAFAPANGSCTTSQALGKSTFCCSGACLDGTRIYQPGQCLYFEDVCGDTSASCGANQGWMGTSNTGVASGDGGCWFGNDCVWEKLNYNWTCCDCPPGYQAVNNSCGGSSTCAACPSPLQVVTTCPTAGTLCKTRCTPSGTSCDFYSCLDANVGPCGPNGYPLAYGYKYCSAYAANAHQFSAQGQTWIRNVRLCLQQALKSDATSCRSCAAVAADAYATHPTCYLESGFCSLPLTDWIHVLGTVGWKNFITHIGGEVFATVSGCVKAVAWLTDGIADRGLDAFTCAKTGYLCA